MTLPPSLLGMLPALRGRAQANAPLAPFTWFRVGGPAEVLVRPADADDLAAFLRVLPRDIQVHVIGACSNLIIRDGGLPGVTVKLARGFSAITTEPDGVVAGAAALDLTVSERAAAAGLTGLEFLSGIPGTIGGAATMNAGAYGGDMAQVVDWVEVVTRTGEQRRMAAAELAFAYRHSRLPHGAVITRVRLRAHPGAPAAIAARMNDIRANREASQPIRARTGGSTFRNPPGMKAWELIDAAGCRGLTHGGAMVSEKHCNFLINTGNATAADIEELGEEVRRRVLAMSGVNLEWEIRRIGVAVRKQPLPLAGESLPRIRSGVEARSAEGEGPATAGPASSGAPEMDAARENAVGGDAIACGNTRAAPSPVMAGLDPIGAKIGVLDATAAHRHAGEGRHPRLSLWLQHTMSLETGRKPWMPAFAGMTVGAAAASNTPILAPMGLDPAMTVQASRASFARKSDVRPASKNQKRVAVLYGGMSAEREVSLSSGLQVIAALREAGFAVIPIEVGDDLAAVIAALTPRPDAVFNALHGRFGEDGAIQGVLDWLNIPYTHSGVRASALAMDKAMAKAVFTAAGLPVPRGRVVPVAELEAGDPLPLPYVVKPVNEGSSVGVEIIRAGDNRRAEVARAWRFGSAPMVEEYIAGRELTVGVMGDRALNVTEIVAEAGTFYDYESKYAEGGSRHIIPAAVHPDIYAHALDVALAAHRALGCRGASRADFRYDDTQGEPGRLVLLEVNTQPGLTPTSLLPEQAASLGMNFPQLCTWMVENAACRA